MYWFKTLIAKHRVIINHSLHQNSWREWGCKTAVRIKSGFQESYRRKIYFSVFLGHHETIIIYERDIVISVVLKQGDNSIYFPLKIKVSSCLGHDMNEVLSATPVIDPLIRASQNIHSTKKGIVKDLIRSGRPVACTKSQLHLSVSYISEISSSLIKTRQRSVPLEESLCL